MARAIEAVCAGIVRERARRVCAKPAIRHVFVLRRTQQNTGLHIGRINKDFRSAHGNFVRTSDAARRKFSRNSGAKIKNQASRQSDQSREGEPLAESAPRDLRWTRAGRDKNSPIRKIRGNPFLPGKCVGLVRPFRGCRRFITPAGKQREPRVLGKRRIVCRPQAEVKNGTSRRFNPARLPARFTQADCALRRFRILQPLHTNRIA